MDEPDGITRAAGAVLWRHDGVGIEIAVIHRPRYDDWSFPKGKLDRGEHVLLAAVREVEEETGVRPRLGRRLPARTYLKNGRSKRVDYWAATGEPGVFVPGAEVDRLEWLPVSYAEQRLTYAHDIDLLHEFDAGPRETIPIVILRHGSAGERAAWPADDALRPLDEGGLAEAAALTDLLGAFGSLRVISSATVRCVGTVIPYALRWGIRVETEPAFTVASVALDPSGSDADGGGYRAGVANLAEARAAVLELAATRTPTVVCTHGEIVAELVRALCSELGEKTPDDPGLRKGGFWIVHIGDGEIAAMERHHAVPARS
ncbi:MAG TPA: NUDIX domain-containing protein [Streptosporangiaceae bacterium]|nr:NUDIX domain-containing protein [Streptosporangiaceae bacterium]